MIKRLSPLSAQWIFCCLADGLIISSAVPGGFTKPVDQAALLDAVGKVLYGEPETGESNQP
jgi:hypothetical protein